MYKLGRNPYDLVRTIGYKPIKVTEREELNCVRPLAGDYPRFHIYLKEDGDIFSFNIHLDQKRPVYEGATAHGGDYDSDVVQEEVARIKDLLFRD